MKLLVVEDDSLIGPAMKAVLTAAGHTVLGPARNTVKALRLVQGEKPDLALVDYHLAGKEDGLGLVRRLAAEHRVPSLLVTGYDHRANDVRDDALGLLRKPFSPDALLSAVVAAGTLLSGRRPAPAPALELFR